MHSNHSNRHEVLARRLAPLAQLSDAETGALRDLTLGPQRALGARQDLVREGDRPRVACLITSGWASRYKMLEDGRRQTLAFLMPGDICDVAGHLLDGIDHSIGAVTPITYVEIPHDRLDELAQRHPALGRALLRQLLTCLSIQREWTLNLGRRSALERLSHLLCELFLRLEAAGLTEGTACDLPITQIDMSEATGLTSVHVNRTLQEMRARDLVQLKGRRLDIPDLARLERVALFNRSYLHLAPPPVRARAVAPSGQLPA